MDPEQRPTLALPTLLKFPVELLLQIAEACTTVDSTSSYRRFDDGKIDRIYFQRRDSLRALSQTSSLLRTLLLPLAWECLEACCSRGENYTDRVRYLVDKQDRLSKGLIENPELAKYIRVAMVSMHPLIRDHKTIPVGLLRCLRSLPNLHTLRLFHLEYRLRLSLEFYSSIPPQVRTIAIAQHVIQPHIIVSFRWWAQIASYEGMNTGRDVENLLDDSEKTLEELDGFALDDAAVDYLVKTAPHLRKISLSSWISAETLARLRSLTKLQVIVMAVVEHQGRHREPKTPAMLDEWLETAASVLRAQEMCALGERKNVKMRYRWAESCGTASSSELRRVERIEDIYLN